ncbi:hypothetical protein [Kaistella yonginensis]|uniref:hypothetical protein n=1 Tax=Kaistella yonginensis TaxID=658267 RepID=UPI0025B46F34|nr:hypothetical protein [Kaistella yonginensis]MDN3606999.1 hypothetical protein [Kaistella yonginensis]
MKFILVLTGIFCFGLVLGQNKQEYVFKFNVKKWNKEFLKQHKPTKDGMVSINLFDVNGKAVLFEVQEKSISEVNVPDIKIFKGKSTDDTKIITLTILPKTMSGAYLEKGIQYFIEAVKGSCNHYKVYTKPEIDKKIEVGQIEDYIK